MNCKKITGCFMALLLAGFSSVTAGAVGIIGTPHDFSQQIWNTGNTFQNEICVVCHVPHNGAGAAASPVGLLWNRPVTAASFTPYDSPTLKFTPGQPDGASKLCLSCHDGTIAVDQFGSKVLGTTFVGGSRLLGTDLMNDHPISFTFDTALANAVGTLKDPAIAPSGLPQGGTIAQDMLRAGKLQCVSCHNPHNPAGNARFLVKSNNNSALCLTCHNFGG